MCLLIPEMPEKVPQALVEYLQRFVAQVDDGLVSIVTLALDSGSEGASPAVIFDIDVGWTFAAMKPDADLIWAKLERMREIKNEVFDASLTSDTKVTFQ